MSLFLGTHDTYLNVPYLILIYFSPLPNDDLCECRDFGLSVFLLFIMCFVLYTCALC